MSIVERLMDRPKNVGFRFGFIAIVLVMIVAVLPSFIVLGVNDPQITNFQNMFLTGMIGTLFFSVMLRQSSKTKAEGGIIFSPQNITKQFAVVTIGITAGLLLVVMNGVMNQADNILFGSIWGQIDAQAFYLGMLAGVAEELFFRGFIGTFLRLVSPSLVLALLPSAAIFALFHYFAYAEVGAFVVLFALGLILGLIHEFTNDIGAPMLAHVLNNMFAMMPVVIAVLVDNMFIIIGVVVLFMVIAFRKGPKG